MSIIIKTVLLSVCIVSSARSIIGQIAGHAKMIGQIKLVLDIIFVLLITEPFMSGFIKFELPDIDNYEISDYYEEQEIFNNELASQTASNVCDIISEQLEAEKIQYERLSVEVNISDDGCISISRVTVITEEIDRVSEVIHNTLGIETEVVNEGI